MKRTLDPKAEGPVITVIALKVTQINYVSRNKLHSTEFLLSTFEFERQNIAGCCKQFFCIQFISKIKT